MAESQRNEPYEEPPREEIPKISRMHVQAMETTDADEVWVGAGMKQLVLRTVGRKSGNEHKVALPYWVDDAGHKHVVASFAGAEQHPHWYLNLTDREANAEVLVRTRDGSHWAEPEILDGDEYQRIWDALTADREFYREYQTRTERRIPLIRLNERRPA
ncbi:MAG: nitroreductase/quinone reductase family protein [Acidimicrobiia bacterium]